MPEQSSSSSSTALGTRVPEGWYLEWALSLRVGDGRMEVWYFFHLGHCPLGLRHNAIGDRMSTQACSREWGQSEMSSPAHYRFLTVFNLVRFLEALYLVLHLLPGSQLFIITS